MDFNHLLILFFDPNLLSESKLSRRNWFQQLRIPSKGSKLIQSDRIFSNLVKKVYRFCPFHLFWLFQSFNLLFDIFINIKVIFWVRHYLTIYVYESWQNKNSETSKFQTEIVLPNPDIKIWSKNRRLPRSFRYKKKL